MYDICTIGHITNDKVVTSKSVRFMPGGTAFYFSKALQHLDINFTLLTAVASTEQPTIQNLQNDGINVVALPSQHTVFFENIYHDDQDYREQNVLETADPFSIATMPDIDAAIYHLGPLLAEDIPVDMIQLLASKGLVSIDIQGYLRSVKNRKVQFADWADKYTALPYVSIVKANEFEMEIITGTNLPEEGAKILAGLGVKEVIITLGSKGSLVYSNETFYEIPAYKPTIVADATGCGDTYMAGYLYKKIKGASIEEAGGFGAAMATLKIQSSGPFAGDIHSIENLLAHYQL